MIRLSATACWQADFNNYSVRTLNFKGHKLWVYGISLSVSKIRHQTWLIIRAVLFERKIRVVSSDKVIPSFYLTFPTAPDSLKRGIKMIKHYFSSKSNLHLCYWACRRTAVSNGDSGYMYVCRVGFLSLQFLVSLRSKRYLLVFVVHSSDILLPANRRKYKSQKSSLLTTHGKYSLFFFVVCSLWSRNVCLSDVLFHGFTFASINQQTRFPDT